MATYSQALSLTRLRLCSLRSVGLVKGELAALQATSLDWHIRGRRKCQDDCARGHPRAPGRQGWRQAEVDRPAERSGRGKADAAEAKLLKSLPCPFYSLRRSCDSSAIHSTIQDSTTPRTSIDCRSLITRRREAARFPPQYSMSRPDTSTSHRTSVLPFETLFENV